MSLRAKILIIICLSCLLLMALLSYFSWRMLYQNAVASEEIGIKREIEVFLSAIDYEVNVSDAVVGDWAPWDDTYKFIQDRNKEYISSNLTIDTFVNLEIDFVLYIDDAKQLVFGMVIDAKTKQKIPLSSDFVEQIILASSEQTKAKTAGILSTPQGNIIFSLQHIFPTQKDKPPRGFLVMGKWLDEDLIAQLSQRTKLRVSLYPFTDTDLPDDVLLAKEKLSSAKEVFIKAQNSSVASGYTYLNDVFGVPTLLIKIDVERGIFLQAQSSLRFLFYSLIIITAFFCVLLIFILDKLVLSRLSSLTSSIRQIGKEGLSSSRLDARGNDEISVLAQNMNDMLDSLEILQLKKQETERQYKELIDSMHDTVWVINFEGKVIDVNKATCEILGYSQEEIFRIGLEEIDTSLNKDVITNLIKTIPEDKLQVFETTHKTKSGNIIPVEVSSSLVDYLGQKAILSIARDITERKMAEDKIKTLLKEKEILLKETHHRIKNNMTIVKSMLSLEGNSQTNENCKRILMDAASRVQSMAVLYNKLYRSDTYRELNIKDFLQPLINEIIGQFKTEIPVKIDLRIDDCLLPSQLLSSLGIIMNECITNSIKYAFSACENPLITVTFMQKEKTAILTYADNGCGLPDNVSLENSNTFGLKLIHMLVEDIFGKIRIENGQGVKFIIEFPASAK
ncbi:MAG TPA: CHASE4 domain-containing protein [Candidatus Cloacimonadota bacterium]|nr:CHASE4 domain-containing protein [Candidatus Cloacimonadota bacterium]